MYKGIGSKNQGVTVMQEDALDYVSDACGIAFVKNTDESEEAKKELVDWYFSSSDWEKEKE